MTDPTRPPVPELPEPTWTPEQMRELAGLQPLPTGVHVMDTGEPLGIPVERYAKVAVVAQRLIEDAPAMRAAIQMQVEDLYLDLAGQGKRWAGDPSIYLEHERFPFMMYGDPRSRLRRVWDWIRRRPWTPAPPPYALRVEVRAA